MSRTVPRWQVISSGAVVVLAVASSLLGLFRRGHYPSELLPGFQIQDAFILSVGTTALAVGVWYAQAGSKRGRIVWLGALAYMSYMWATIALQVPFNRFFLGYVVLFGLSTYTLVGGIAATDPGRIEGSVAAQISERVYGLFLWLIAVGLTVLWLSELVPATVSGTAPLLVEEIGPQVLVSHFIDLSVVVPGLWIAGSLVRRGDPWGYVFAGIGLVFGALLAPTLVGTTLALLLGDAVTVPALAVVFTSLPALAALGLAVKYVLSISDGTPSRG